MAAAKYHMQLSGLKIEYRKATAESLAESEPAGPVGPVEQAEAPEPAPLPGDGEKPESSAARRRWAGFTS